MNIELTIVIPAKNEEKHIANLLRSLGSQTYYKISNVKIYLADANSTDATINVARSAAAKYNLRGFEVIPGGMPSIGRNAGAKRAETEFILFLDADVYLADKYLLEKALLRMRLDDMDLITTNVACPTGRKRDKILYYLSNWCQRVSKWIGVPFATGMFMLWRTRTFIFLGGFDEEALYGEDYELSKRVDGDHFSVIQGRIETTNRRYIKIGIWGVVWLSLKVFFLTWRSDKYFKKNQNYWNLF